MSQALSAAEVAAGLAELSGWEQEGESLVKTFRFESYLAGVAFASSVGILSEGLDHHPDMSIGWRWVRVAYTTHDAGNQLTPKDFAAARAIDALGYPK